MHEQRFLSLLLPALIALPSAGQVQDLPDAAEILDRHVAATGGKEARLSIKGRRKTGKLAVDMAGHRFVAETVEQFLAPNQSHRIIDGEFFSQVFVCNGEHAWEWSPGHDHGHGQADAGNTDLLNGARRKKALEGSQIHGEVHWRKRYTEAKTLGVAEVEGKPAYEVQLTTPAGETFTQFYDQASGRLAKRVRNSPTRTEVVATVSFFSQYKEFDGIWIPTRIHAEITSPSMGEGTQTWTYSSVEHDVEISESLFELPAELRAQAAELDQEGAGSE